MNSRILNIFITIIVLLVCGSGLKAQHSASTFHPDSIPPAIQELEQYHLHPETYLKLWKRLKVHADTNNSKTDGYFLYKDRNYFHYINGEVDSVRKYTTIIQGLSPLYNDTHGYYYSWLILCETLHNVGEGTLSTQEREKMYTYASNKKSNIGIAYSQYAIASGYLFDREYAKAAPFIAQAMQKFFQMKRWDIYTTLASNQIILLSALHKERESNIAFQKLDSLANQAIQGNLPGLSPRNIAMTKYLAFSKCAQSGDMKTFKKYLTELEKVYEKYPTTPRFYLYDGMQTYAHLTGDNNMQVAYIDSCAKYFKQRNSRENERRMYYNKANALAQGKRYEEAYEMMDAVVQLGDTLKWESSDKQLNYLSTKYNVNKLEFEKRELSLKARNTQLALVLSISSILLIALCVIIAIYRNKLKLHRRMRQQDLQLIAANEKVRKAAEIKNVFIQNMNHEIRTPLNSIVGFSDLLSGNHDLSQDEVQEVSDAIKNNSNNLLKLISDMLSISSLDSESEEPVQAPFSLHSCCEQAMGDVRDFICSGVSLRYTPSDKNIILNSNEKIVRQILFNLLHNATKFTTQGEIELSYHIGTNENSIHIQIRDTGIGIPQEATEKIFERFYKVDTFSQGSGLGLSLCRILAQRLKGKIYLNTQYQTGSLFVFVHPLP